MIKYDEARALVESSLNAGGAGSEYVRFAIVDEHTIERPYGWVFFWTTEKFLQTRDYRFAMVGNSPILVLRSDGSLHRLGTVLPAKDYLANYEREHALE